MIATLAIAFLAGFSPVMDAVPAAEGSTISIIIEGPSDFLIPDNDWPI